MDRSLYSIKDLTHRFARAGGLFKRKSTISALRRVSLEVPEGSAYGIVGESGSGKTTLARLMVGLLEAQEGDLKYSGRPVREWLGDDPWQFRRRVQFVFQDPVSSFNPRRTIGAALDDPLRRLTDLDETGRKRRIAEILDRLRMTPGALRRYPHEFSGGQAQRLAVARALAVRPDVLVMDEPVSALDVSVQAALLNLLKELREEFGLTYILISHDLGVVDYLCDAVAVFREGELIETGPCREVLESPSTDYVCELRNAVLAV